MRWITNPLPHNPGSGSKWQRVEVLHLKDSFFRTDWLNRGTFTPWHAIQQISKKAVLIILMWKHCQNIISGINILSHNIPSACMGCYLATVVFVCGTSGFWSRWTQLVPEVSPCLYEAAVTSRPHWCPCQRQVMGLLVMMTCVASCHEK